MMLPTPGRGDVASQLAGADPTLEGKMACMSIGSYADCARNTMRLDKTLDELKVRRWMRGVAAHQSLLCESTPLAAASTSVRWCGPRPGGGTPSLVLRSTDLTAGFCNVQDNLRAEQTSFLELKVRPLLIGCHLWRPP